MDESAQKISQRSLSDKYIAGLLSQFSVSDDLAAIRTNCIEEIETDFAEGELFKHFSTVERVRFRFLVVSWPLEEDPADIMTN